MTSKNGFAAFLLALAGVVALTESELRAQAFDITGVWRDENANEDDATTPQKETLNGTPAFEDNFHGTYRSRPYLLITLQDKSKPQGPYFLYSDIGDLRAELRPTTGTPNDLDVIDRRSGKTLGILRIGADECDGRSPCFAFINASSDLGVPAAYDAGAVLYVPVGTYDKGANPKLEQKYSDMFSPLSANFSYIFKCWNLAKMDTTNYQTPGCGAALFAMPPSDSFGYNKIGFNNWHDAAVPFAWTYVSTLFQNGEDRGRTWENGQDVAEADSLKVGVKASVSIMGVEASSHVSVGVQNKVDNMYSSKLTYSKAEYLVTQFAFVLNKFYASLDPKLVDRIQLIKALPDARRAAEYDRFVIDFGTHFANAITFGAKGERQLRMSQSQVLAMNESKVDVSVGMTAGYGGVSVGVDVDTSKENMQKITKNTSSEDRNWFCYGGGSCSDGVPSGDAALPVQLDLRPISELFAPPFFADDEIITTIRDGISQSIGRYAFVKRDNLQQPSAVFATVTGFSRWNITSIGADVQSTKFDPNECGTSTPCNDGLVTLTDSGGLVTQIPAVFTQQPAWRIPATLVPDPSAGDGVVTADFTWSGKCLGGGGTWTAADGASTRVRLPDLTVKPGISGGVDRVSSPNCVTGGNPLGLVTSLGTSRIILVESAASLLTPQ